MLCNTTWFGLRDLVGKRTILWAGLGECAGDRWIANVGIDDWISNEAKDINGDGENKRGKTELEGWIVNGIRQCLILSHSCGE